MRRVLVCGAAGFVGAHLVTRLKSEGAWVRGIDLGRPPFSAADADECIEGDLRDPHVANDAADGAFDEVYQLAADMGGAGFVSTGAHDAAILSNSVLINVNVLKACARAGAPRVFFPSSACVYPASVQRDPQHADCAEGMAYPADPDTDYGWEKLFSERLYAAFGRTGGIHTRIARFHSIYGPRCTWRGGREKSVAALCRKVAEAPSGSAIEVWGDGQQTRSFMYIEDALDGMVRLMRSGFAGPVNLGSDEMLSIRALAELLIDISGKPLSIRFVDGPQGVRGRNSDNTLAWRELQWAPRHPLRDGLAATYAWIDRQVAAARAASPMEAAR
jgi:nucleoside-diphosphate-sugar epimerase